MTQIYIMNRNYYNIKLFMIGYVMCGKLKMAIMDVDTQELFFNKRYLYNGASNDTIDLIELCLIQSLRNNIGIISTTYMYPYNNAKNTIVETYDKLNKTIMVDANVYYNVANTNNGIDLSIADTAWQMCFERQSEDIWDVANGQPDNLQTFLRTENIDIITIIGNNSKIDNPEINLSGSIVRLCEGLQRLKYKVQIVSDAVVGLDCDTVSKFCKVITSEQFLSENNNGVYQGWIDENC